MIEDEEQPQLINTIGESPTEEVGTIEEDIYVLGVESLNGKTGDLSLKTINGEDLLEEGNIDLQTPLDNDQMSAVNSGIDAEKVSQIAANADNITTLQNTKQDNLTQTQLNAVNSGIDQTKVAQIATNTGNITSNTNRITTIEGKIPSAASSSNQLTDKNYVDNSIATNTANYISDNGQPFQSYADLEAYSGPLTNNDYAFVVSTDAAGNLLYTRYKYNADQELWAEEYTIANPTFTADQWAAINSGVTQNDVNQIDTNKGEIAGLQTSKQDALSQTQLDAINSGIDATKVQQISDNTTAIATKQDKLVAGANIQIGPDGKTISATDTTYTAGTGLTLTGTQFSVTEPVPTGFFTDTAATQEGTGTTITLNNTVDAPIDKAELKGDTYQKTYSGKNFIDFATVAYTDVNNATTTRVGTTYTVQTNSTDRWGATSFGIYQQLEPSTTYTFSAKVVSTTATDGSIVFVTKQTTNTGTQMGGNLAKAGERSSVTFTTAASLASGAGVRLLPFETSATAVFDDIQIEKASSYTGYEPYVGGVPSPNPDYPQDIQVVTGEQTVTVSDGGSNSQSYTIDLGSMELCKIGTYQDYIWKDGSDWKIHKEIGKHEFDGTESIVYNSSGGFVIGQANLDILFPGVSSSGPLVGYSDMFTIFAGTSTWKGEGLMGQSSSGTFWCQWSGLGSSTAACQTWLATNKPILFTVVSATDTTITDAALIAQLEALGSSTTYSPQTNYSVLTPTPNLPTILTVDVFKDNYAGLLARLNKAGA